MFIVSLGTLFLAAFATLCDFATLPLTIFSSLAFGGVYPAPFTLHHVPFPHPALPLTICSSLAL